MATDAQIKANRENAQHSAGPVSEAGRQAVSQNRTVHGLAGEFKTRDQQEAEELREIVSNLLHDYNATTQTEVDLVYKMAEAQIRSTRAMYLQDSCVDFIDSNDEVLAARGRKDLELYLRYQAHHDRAYQRHAAELRKFQSGSKKAEIGFESQTRRQAQETRRENTENRQRERHENALALDKVRIEHRQLLNRKLSGEIFTAESAQTQRTGELLAA